MKKIMALLMAAILAAILIGCGVEKDSTPKIYQNRMEYAGSNIYIDTETGVCYLWGKGSYTVMVDREGKPFIANGWRDWSDGDALY